MRATRAARCELGSRLSSDVGIGQASDDDKAAELYRLAAASAMSTRCTTMVVTLQKQGRAGKRSSTTRKRPTRACRRRRTRSPACCVDGLLQRAGPLREAVEQAGVQGRRRIRVPSSRGFHSCTSSVRDMLFLSSFRRAGDFYTLARLCMARFPTGALRTWQPRLARQSNGHAGAGAGRDAASFLKLTDASSQQIVTAAAASRTAATI